MLFDARTAKLLKPGEHIIVDASLGLRLVVTASRRTWTYRYKSPVDGRMCQMALGQWLAMPQRWHGRRRGLGGMVART